MSGKMSAVRHELLSGVADAAAELAKDYGLDPDHAEQLGCAVADHLALAWGGQNITIPKDHKFKLCQRDMEIWEEFDGHNHSYLARKYGVGVKAIYKILKRVGRYQRDKSQPSLF